MEINMCKNKSFLPKNRFLTTQNGAEWSLFGRLVSNRTSEISDVKKHCMLQKYNILCKSRFLLSKSANLAHISPWYFIIFSMKQQSNMSKSPRSYYNYRLWWNISVSMYTKQTVLLCVWSCPNFLWFLLHVSLNNFIVSFEKYGINYS